ncbi:MAG: hypothetical protein KDD53_08225 [Bdellovibrionales bacterium]|nr:hypothetical protein [Bdellovibrionales bacterium]
MRTDGPVSEPEIEIEVDLSSYSVVDGMINLRGGEPATAWSYVGGQVEGDTFHARETTGGIAENEPDIFLVDGRVFDELGMSRLPPSTARSSHLRELVDDVQGRMERNLQGAIEEDPRFGRYEKD